MSNQEAASSGNEPIQATTTETRHWGRSLAAIAEIWANYRGRRPSHVFSPSDDMTHPDWDQEGINYQAVGINAIEVILSAMLATGKTEFRSILDMPCGFGRVARHLAVAFPDARLYASDLYTDRIEFCAKEFGAIPIKSNQSFAKVKFPEKFDLIWCGSLLTNLPEREFKDALKLFIESLTDGGVAIVTTLGRFSPYVQHNIFPYLTPDVYASSRIEKKFASTGFGYGDYNRKSFFFEQDQYGIAFAKPSYVLQCLQGDERIRVKAFSERGWDDQQDYVVIQKVPLNSKINPDVARA